MNNKSFQFFCLVLLVSSAFCWWDLGHMTVAHIAQYYLKQQNKTTQLNKFTQLITAFNKFTDGKSNTFDEAAVWADDIKSYGATMFDNYHFTNVPYDPEYLFKGFDRQKIDIQAINVTNYAMRTLKANKDGITFQRAFMARYLLHLVGDTHQPLHSVNMFNSFHKNGDRGGNDINITYIDGTKTNLHSYLDSMGAIQSLTQRITRPLNNASRDYVDALAATFIIQNPVDKFGKELIEVSDPHTWVIESYLNSAKDIYPFVKDNSTITAEFDAKIKVLCRERVSLAGYRLGYMISQVYA